MENVRIFALQLSIYCRHDMYKRLLQDHIIERLIEQPNKVVLLYGPRQAGKTTLAKHILAELVGKKLEINADEQDYAAIFASRSLKKLQELVGDSDVLFIDEAQRIPDIGMGLKILHDSIPELRIVASGSSSFDLANKTQEPLTGRTWSYHLFPMGICELHHHNSRLELDRSLESFLLYGLYPGVLNLPKMDDKIEHLRNLSRAYLYKDVLDLAAIKHERKLQDLVKLLALQIGSEVSMSELANSLQIAKETVMHYIDILEKAFVVFRLGGLSRNLRKEVTRHDKIYFYDLGIRNAVIENFNPIEFRSDKGAMWENFLIVERLKLQTYNRKNALRYFWRTYTGAEIDYVEEQGGVLTGFEFKYGTRSGTAPKSWFEAYPEARFEKINRDNYLDFIL